MELRILSLWYTRLRWIAFFGQLFILVLAVGPFALSLPSLKIVLLLSLIPISNLIAHMAFTEVFSERHFVGALLAFDTLILTGVLSMAGGPSNPFTIVFLLHVVLAAVMLTPIWTWGIAVLSSLGFGCLFVYSFAVPEWEIHGAHHGLSLHLHGMLFAYIVVALSVAYFLNKIVAELQSKERKLERLQSIVANQQRLASLTTITANAAHELGTPLATIAVVSHELERVLIKRSADKDILADINLLKNETSRCKAIIQELSLRSGDVIGEAPQTLPVLELLNEAIGALKSDCEIKLMGSLGTLLTIPRKALTIAIRALIKNAVEATTASKEPIEIGADSEGNEIILSIKDYGSGMDSESLERLGEPFFSTKQDRGMGLGVYLSKLTLEQLGGALQFKSVPKQGTMVLMKFPINCAESRKAA